MILILYCDQILVAKRICQQNKDFSVNVEVVSRNIPTTYLHFKYKCVFKTVVFYNNELYTQPYYA